MSSIIQRDAGDKFKGVRLQKLRLAALMLDAIQESDRAYVYGATEHLEDVVVKKGTPDVTELYEQNKNFDSSVNFTYNSVQVTNSMVSFLDIWIERTMSEKNLFFGYYTTANIGKEATTEFIKSRGMTLPDKPILELLKKGEFDYPNLLDCVKQLTLAEYEKQYSKSNKKGYVEIIKKFSDDDWKKFLKCINWQFGECDEVALKGELLQRIRSCKYFDHTMEGKEGVVLSELMELFDERQAQTDVTEKFVHGSDIKIKFFEARSTFKVKSEDPVWQMWQKIDAPNDKRNLVDKIQAVCASFDKRKTNQYARKVARSLMEKGTFETDRAFLSARYRVFERCEEELQKIIADKSGLKTMTEPEVEGIISRLYEIGKKEIENSSKEFAYRYFSDSVIEGVILELFESCYLSLDFN